MIAQHPWSSVLLLVAGLLLWPSASARAARRLRLVLPPRGPAVPQAVAARIAPTPRRRLLAGLAGLAAALLIGGPVGVAAGAAVALTGDRLLRRGGPEAERAVRSALHRDLPVACDLLAVCLQAGLPVGGALAAVGSALPAPLGARLAAVAGLYRLGAEPPRAWADVGEELGSLARALVRAGDSGASVVPALGALASDLRASARAAVEADVRRAGVWVLAPLGLCFLPAFVCLGVVPLVIGIAGDVLG